jgi:integrase
LASTEKLPSGRYRGVYRDAAGNKQHVTGTYGRKSDAKDAADEAEVRARRQAAIATGTLTAKITWSEWWAIFNADREFDSDNARTEAQIVERYIEPEWGAVPLNKIEHQAVQDWIDRIKRGKSPSYVQRIFSVLSVSINAAVAKGVLTASPTHGVKVPKRVKRQKVFTTPEDTAKLQPKLKVQYQDAIEFLNETGLRPNELAGLHTDQVDLGTGWLAVTNVYVHRKKTIRSYPKDRDTREVPLSAKAVEIVKRRLEGRDLTAGCGVPHSDGEACTGALVFLSARNRVMNRDVLGQAIRVAAKAVGTKAKSPYASRRGFATRLADGGLDAFALADLMGHSDIAQTREYVQRSQAARARVLAALGEQQPLTAVDGGVGRRGTPRGTNPDNQPSRSTPTDGQQQVG